MANKPRLLRITTVPISLKLLLRGQLSFFSSEGFEVLAVSADGPEVDDLRNEGIAHEVVPMTRTISPLKDLQCLIRLVSVIKTFRPDIVHTHTPKAGLLGMLAAWYCRVPIRLHTVAGLPLMERKGLVKRLLTFTERITYRCATAVYPNSTGLKNFIEAHLSTRTPVKALGKGSSNGIDTGYFEPNEKLQADANALRESHGITRDHIVFSFIGRVVRDKGVNELLKAFDDLSGEMYCSLILAGPFEDELNPISDHSRMIIANNRNVITLGFVHDVRPVLLASDIFVFPSYREGFPNVLMQACCMERPCVTTDINGCNEIIAHEETGLLVPPKDAGALKKAMARLASDAELRKKFSGKARAFVVENFARRLLWEELLKEYRMWLEKRASD